ncbi:interferon-induced GTP-binding protein Mx2 [Clathrospora elynae]|uniref:Interferon-induced GTP-binding protein Mx2 n=1 Tax=Clathrospora elynae TaxID=706981 RepID=A0A6A5T4W3_9PLEO|nr:interferon-induced GTP-binding protein Mx2 [Clathrospora elynae]
MAGTNRTGLSNQVLLDKIDKLRELNVRGLELPQLVVVGDQSSGKSSVLESLTGFSFPQAPGLCTRYATQISCRRDPEQQVTISIIPRPGADAALVRGLRSFRRVTSHLTNQDLETIMNEANQVMGIRIDENHTDPSLHAFSEDILKIEINGPEQEHFTVIDVPGIFRVPSPPLTTDNDVIMVRNMVESYMQNSRTIILAVLPSNVDITTQEILKMAENADPDGTRTMGVLTKPDLVTENTTREAIMDLISGKRNRLRLGYCIVKNRSADDQSSTLADRLVQEKAFFANATWNSLATSRRCGVESLKVRLSDLLMSITKKELPNVKMDVASQLESCRVSLKSLGPARIGQGAQRSYLGGLASRFQTITHCALNGSYDGDSVFTTEPDLKLITAVTKMNEKFANDFCEKGHKRHTSSDGLNEDEKAFDLNCAEDEPSSEDKPTDYPELCDVIEKEDYDCPEPIAFEEDSIVDHIERVYQDNRGPELGTFSGSILAVVFKEQSEKWSPLVRAHVSQAIILVHDYITKLLANICPDRQIRDQLWGHLIIDKVRKGYDRAMRQAHFLLRIELEGKPSTYNHYFNSEVQKKRLGRLDAAIDEQPQIFDSEVGLCFPAPILRSLVVDKNNMQQVGEDILDVLSSYYKVSRKRFVDVICRQVIGHFLLEGELSPLKVFSSELVMGLEAEELEMIAGEDAETKDQRAMLELEIKNWEAAMKLLRL